MFAPVVVALGEPAAAAVFAMFGAVWAVEFPAVAPLFAAAAGVEPLAEGEAVAPPAESFAV